jgi:hypothetical protein
VNQFWASKGQSEEKLDIVRIAMEVEDLVDLLPSPACKSMINFSSADEKPPRFKSGLR